MATLDFLSPIQFVDGVLRLLDQRALPTEEKWVECKSYKDVARCIREMNVRGAPAIGIAAAYGVVLGVKEGAPLDDVYAALAATRPTAVNLFWALDKMRKVSPQSFELLSRIARRIHDDDIAACRAIGANGAPLLPEGGVLTHCNAGGLATGGYGTALGVLRSAFTDGKRLHVFVDETRPFLQGARLTAWELKQVGMPTTVITDNMAAHFMQRGEIQSVIVGADRIAANGDVANKIGTYGVALLAAAHGIPFFVAAPCSTIDLATPDGESIPIEQRPGDEVTHIGDTVIVPADVRVRNPAFDVTPAKLVSAIITERGVVRAPFADELRRLIER